MNGFPILSNVDMDDFFQHHKGYLGTFSKDKLKSVQIPSSECFAVINLENEKDGDGSHWCAVFNRPNEQQVYYFDSYGVAPPEEVQKWLKKSGKEIIYNTSQIQSIESTSCGWYCVAFIYSCLYGDEYLTFTSLFDQDGDKHGRNERRLMKLLEVFHIIH